MKDLEQIKREALDMCDSIGAQLGGVLSGLDALNFVNFMTYMDKRGKERRVGGGGICHQNN